MIRMLFGSTPFIRDAIVTNESVEIVGILPTKNVIKLVLTGIVPRCMEVFFRPSSGSTYNRHELRLDECYIQFFFSFANEKTAIIYIIYIYIYSMKIVNSEFLAWST